MPIVRFLSLLDSFPSSGSLPPSLPALKRLAPKQKGGDDNDGGLGDDDDGGGDGDDHDAEDDSGNCIAFGRQDIERWSS